MNDGGEEQVRRWRRGTEVGKKRMRFDANLHVFTSSQLR